MQAKGKIESCEVGKRKDGTEIKGFKKDGTSYTNYKYKIGGRFYSGFDSLKDFDVEVGDNVIISYKEEPNDDHPDKPYKNIVNITRTNDEADKQYNVKDVGERKDIEETIEQPKAYEDAQIKGMVFKKTIDWIIATRKLALKGLLRDKENKLISAQDYTLEKNFDTVFDFLMKKVK